MTELAVDGLRTYDRKVPQRTGKAAPGFGNIKQRTQRNAGRRGCSAVRPTGLRANDRRPDRGSGRGVPAYLQPLLPNKEAVIGALIEEISDHVAAALDRQPYDITEHEALVRAHIEVLRAPAAVPRCDAVRQGQRFHQHCQQHPMLGLASFTFRPEGPTQTTVEAIARRMGLPVAHPAVRIVFDTWAVLMATALGVPGSGASDPVSVSERIEASYAIFTRLWQPWLPQGQPRRARRGLSDYVHLRKHSVGTSTVLV